MKIELAGMKVGRSFGQGGGQCDEAVGGRCDGDVDVDDGRVGGRFEDDDGRTGVKSFLV